MKANIMNKSNVPALRADCEAFLKGSEAADGGRAALARRAGEERRHPRHLDRAGRRGAVVDHHARLTISIELGHERLSVVAVYCGR